jgi:hypothetical protein
VHRSGAKWAGSPKRPRATPASAARPRKRVRADAKQLERRDRRDERVGDDGAVLKRQRRSQLAIDFGDEQREGWDLGCTVEHREPAQRELVVGERAADRDLGVRNVHELHGAPYVT